jgi:hypothetical protein
VPALAAAECPLVDHSRRLECPAPGTPAPPSTRRRDERFLSQLSDSFDCACRNLLMSMLRLPGVIDIRALHSTWRCDVRLMVMLCFEPSQRQVGCKRTIT